MPGRKELHLVCDWLGSFEDVRDEWSRLALAGGNVFSTWEWAETWLRHLGDRQRLRLLGLRRPDGALVGILPLDVGRRGPLRVARVVGHGVADQLGPVCAPEDRPDVAEAIAQAAASGDLGPILVLDRLARREGWANELGARVVHRESSPVLELGGRDWEEYLTGRSANFRSQMRRFERKLVQEHGLSYRLCLSREQLGDDFEALVDLHRARWEDHSQAFDGGLKDFHQDFASVALERGWLRLWVAEVEGQAVAAWYGFRFAGAESFYQAGRDPAWDRSKLGFVLLGHTIRSAFEDGMREYRFLRGDEAYKSRFADSDELVETAALGTGTAGRLAVGAGARLASSSGGRRLASALFD